jgi:hypothetical protein
MQVMNTALVVATIRVRVRNSGFRTKMKKVGKKSARQADFFFLPVFRCKQQFKSMEVFFLRPGMPLVLVYLAYYLLLIINVLVSVWLILAGLSDPFGGFLVFAGSILIVLMPILLRIVFGLLLKELKRETSESLSR